MSEYSFAVNKKSSIRHKNHSNINIDFGSQTSNSFNFETDIYDRGLYYSSTLTKNIGSFSFGLTGQNFSSFDDSEAIYGILSLTENITENLSVNFGAMPGIFLPALDFDYYNFFNANYNVCNIDLITIGVISEKNVVSLNINNTITIGNSSLAFSYISGNNSMSSVSFSAYYQFTKDFQPYIGYEILKTDDPYLMAGFNLTF